MSSPNSKRIMPNWNSTQKTSRDSNENSNIQFSIKRRSFEPLSPEKKPKARRNSDNMDNDQGNGSLETNAEDNVVVENNEQPESSVGSERVSSVTENNNDQNSVNVMESRLQGAVSSSNEEQVDDGNQPDSTTAQQVPTSSSNLPRVMCQYGPTCYRKNATHREIFSHPGDPDYNLRTTPANKNFLIKSNDDAPECRFGALCYRKNPQHFRDNKHPQISSAGRPLRNRNRANTGVIDLSSESEYEDDYSGDDDEEYMPPDSESSYAD